MVVNRIAENYVVRQVFVLAGVIFLIFRGRLGDFFWPRLLGASLNYAFLGGRDGLFLGMGIDFFLTRIRIGASPDCPGTDTDGARIGADFFIFLDWGRCGVRRLWRLLVLFGFRRLRGGGRIRVFLPREL